MSAIVNSIEEVEQSSQTVCFYCNRFHYLSFIVNEIKDYSGGKV